MKTVIGLNIREPYATLIATGQKTIETRSYHIPEHLLNTEIAIVATGGAARVIGSMVVSGCSKYTDENQFRLEFASHLVARGSTFDWSDEKPKYRWHICDARFFSEQIDAPSRTGMVWRKDCQVPLRKSIMMEMSNEA